MNVYPPHTQLQRYTHKDDTSIFVSQEKQELSFFFPVLKEDKEYWRQGW